MRAILVCVNASPVVVELPDDQAEAFAAIQAIVGGWLECVGFSLRGKRVDVYCDENGLSKRLPQNRKGIVGTFVVIGRRNGAKGSVRMAGFTKEQTATALKVFAKEAP
jgi:hypothetical protein